MTGWIMAHANSEANVSDCDSGMVAIEERDSMEMNGLACWVYGL